MTAISSVFREAYRGIRSASVPRQPAEAVEAEVFRREYDRAVDEVLSFLTTAMQDEIATHNRGWSADRTDFETYLRASWIRYYRCYLHLVADGTARRVCDIGGFWGAWPITLKRLGFDVTMTEALRFYSDTFDRLFAFVRSEGVEILDYDPFDSDAELRNAFDFVTVMAVLEHYPHSLSGFMKNVTAMMADDGRAYLEVPNIALWDKRVAMLKGRSPLVPLDEKLASAVPFIGHHHEFTMRELRRLAEVSGLGVEDEELFNYTPAYEMSLSNAMAHPIRSLAFLLRPDTREILAVCCRRSALTLRTESSVRDLPPEPVAR